jgi:uncharacterized protein
MNLEENVMEQLKTAMKEKNDAGLRALRAIKAAIIIAKTSEGANGILKEEDGVKMLQKLVKQRKDSLEIFTQQNRPELAEKEKEEIDIIEKFLPKQLTEAEITDVVKTIIASMNATSADMGKVIGAANKQLAGTAEGKTISLITKNLLS